MAYNEIGGLETVFNEINSTLKDLSKKYEIIIIDDGSTDGTREIADRLSLKYENVNTIHHKKNRGLGEVYRTGFLHAKGEFVSFFPADGQYPAAIIRQFIKFIENYDLILGYLPRRNCSFVAKCLSKMEKLLYRLFFGPMPKFQGILMFRRAILKKIELNTKEERAWTIVMEFIIKAQKRKYRIKNIPTEIRHRMSGKSKVNNLRTIWANLKGMLRLCNYI